MTRRSIIAFLFALQTLAASSSLAQLNPPPGPVQATDRTRLNQQSIPAFPYLINLSGSYVLTSNIVVPPGVDAFVVNAERGELQYVRIVRLVSQLRLSQDPLNLSLLLHEHIHHRTIYNMNKSLCIS